MTASVNVVALHCNWCLSTGSNGKMIKSTHKQRLAIDVRNNAMHFASFCIASWAPLGGNCEKARSEYIYCKDNCILIDLHKSSNPLGLPSGINLLAALQEITCTTCILDMGHDGLYSQGNTITIWLISQNNSFVRIQTWILL